MIFSFEAGSSPMAVCKQVHQFGQRQPVFSKRSVSASVEATALAPMSTEALRLQQANQHPSHEGGSLALSPLNQAAHLQKEKSTNSKHTLLALLSLP
jgi:hypothetical protein